MLVGQHDFNDVCYKLETFLKKKLVNDVAKKSIVLTTDNNSIFLKTPADKFYLVLRHF